MASDRRTLAVVVVVATSSLVARLWWEVTSGVFVTKEYDDGVYYRAAVLLAEGGALYRDQVFLHPPGLPVLLLPTALLGGAVGDGWGFVAARLLLVAVSTSVAVAVTLHVRGLVGLAGGAAAGLLYAVHPAVVYGGDTVMMEPLLDAATLASVVLLSVPGRRRAVGAGLLLGLAAAVKLWALVPLAVLGAALVLRGRLHEAVVLLLTSVAAAVAVLAVGLRAPAQAWDLAVLTQAGREPGGVVGLGPRLTLLAGTWDLSRPFAVVAAGLALAAVVTAAPRLRASPFLQVWPVIAAVWAVLLLAAPTFWPHYGSVLVLPVAVCAGVAVGTVVDRVPAGARRTSVGVALAVAAPAAVLVGSWGAYPWSEQPVLVAPTPGECRPDEAPGVQALADAVPERVPGCTSPLDPAGERIAAAERSAR